MHLYTEPRYEKLLKQIENKLKKIGVNSSDQFDDLTPEQESELEAIGKSITKVVGQVWDETNYDTAKELWRVEIKNSEFYDVIQYLE